MFANDQKWIVVETITEFGSAFNGHRPKLKKLLLNSNIKVILVEYKDRLIGFGAEYIERALEAQNQKLVVCRPRRTEG